MKITQEQLRQIVAEELESQLQEGVFDYLKGAGKAAGGKASDTGKSVANAISNKANAVKNKVGQVAGDIKTAGSTASLKADIQKTAQDAGMQIQGLIDRFTDLLARAQSMRMEEEESIIKAELQALKNYQETAAAETGDPNADYSDIANDVYDKTPFKKEPEAPEDIDFGQPPSSKRTHSDMHGREKEGDWPSGTEKWAQGSGPAPAPVELGHGQDVPFDWSSKPKTQEQPKPTSQPANPVAKKPAMRTKLDRASIEQAVKAANGDIKAAAKNLGISKDQMIKALGR